MIFLTSLQLKAIAQGGIDAIKNQPYLKTAAKIDCNNTQGDNLANRICANLAFQKADAELVVVYNKLLRLSKKDRNTQQLKKIVRLQQIWRKMRDNHCDIIYDTYDGGHVQAIAFLVCLTELTNSRIRELEKLYASLSSDNQ